MVGPDAQQGRCLNFQFRICWPDGRHCASSHEKMRRLHDASAAIQCLQGHERLRIMHFISVHVSGISGAYTGTVSHIRLNSMSSEIETLVGPLLILIAFACM